jgi:hypothetical protein
LRVKVFDASSSPLKNFDRYNIDPWLEVVGQEASSILLNSPQALIYLLSAVPSLSCGLLKNMYSSNNIPWVACLVIALGANPENLGVPWDFIIVPLEGLEALECCR